MTWLTSSIQRVTLRFYPEAQLHPSGRKRAGSVRPVDTFNLILKLRHILVDLPGCVCVCVCIHHKYLVTADVGMIQKSRSAVQDNLLRF